MQTDQTIAELLIQSPAPLDHQAAATATSRLLAALFQLQLAQRQVTAELQQQSGLSDSDLTALGLLIRLPPSPIKDIAHALGLTPGSTSTLVDRLTRAGMVDRSPAPHDRRVSLVSLTTHGTEVMHSARDRYLFAIDRALTDCTPACLDTTAHVLYGVADGLARSTPIGAPSTAPEIAISNVVHAIIADPHSAARSSRNVDQVQH